jgi:hypothetical protein
MRSRAIVRIILLMVLLASLATPLAMAGRPEEAETASTAQEAQAVSAELDAEPASPILDETLGRPAPESTGLLPLLPQLETERPPVSIASILLDDFNRADGPIGANWTVHDGNCNVSGNAAVCANLGRATFNGAPGNGNAAEADIAVVGTTLQYTGLLLDYGAGVTNLFIKVQEQGETGQFNYAGCYLGNNGSAGNFGPGFFPLSSPFVTAHMKVTRKGDDVTIEFTNIDGGAQAPQTYVCEGAPPAEGTGIGILGYVGLARLDNFTKADIIYSVGLPLAVRYYPWDPYYEPNNFKQDAYGPLASGLDYLAYPDDTNDYYYLFLTSDKTVDILVSDYEPTSDNGDLLIYDETNPSPIAQFGEPGFSEMSIDNLELSAGKYYVRIYTSDDYSDSALYTLRVTY